MSEIHTHTDFLEVFVVNIDARRVDWVTTELLRICSKHIERAAERIIEERGSVLPLEACHYQFVNF